MYLSIFLTAFLAATILPAQSEFVVVAAQRMDYDVWIIWWLASIGNTLGSVVNYVLGRFLVRYQDRRWFERFGKWSLLMAWAPFIGDPLTFIAGMLRLTFWQFLILVFISKAGRYAILLGITQLF